MATVAVRHPAGTVPRLWPGETAVILGGGPSLTPKDVVSCRSKARVIAVKEAYHLAPWADVLYACDPKWWLGEQGAPTFTGLKFAMEPQHRAWPGVCVLGSAGMRGLSLDQTTLATGQNSGYQAINLAVLLGATRILLLGFDLWRSADGRANWFDGMPGIAKSYHTPSPYPMFLDLFASIVEPLKAAGVEVVNCSRTTMLRAFPCQPLDEALP